MWWFTTAWCDCRLRGEPRWCAKSRTYQATYLQLPGIIDQAEVWGARSVSQNTLTICANFCFRKRGIYFLIPSFLNTERAETVEFFSCGRKWPIYWKYFILWLLVACGSNAQSISSHGPLARYIKLQVAHAPGMSGMFSQPPLVSDPEMHHDTCVAHVPWRISGSLNSGFHWSRWRGKPSRNSWRMRNPQINLSGKSPWCWLIFPGIFRCQHQKGQVTIKSYDIAWLQWVNIYIFGIC